MHVINKQGIGTFYKFEPEARGQYGTFKTNGLAIDDIIEGTYSEGNDYKVFEAVK